MNPAITHRHVIVRLLNGPIYQEDLDLWSRLGAEWEKIKAHFGEMGMDVARDDSAGYAYVHQREEDSQEDENWEEGFGTLAQGITSYPFVLPPDHFHGLTARGINALRTKPRRGRSSLPLELGLDRVNVSLLP